MLQMMVVVDGGDNNDGVDEVGSKVSWLIWFYVKYQ